MKDAMKKLQSYIDLAAVPVKERVFEEYKEPEVVKFHRVDQKRKRSEIKKTRGFRNDRD
jgi:hypothetical protein